MIDTVISHYRVLRRLGAGGMGVVYLARDERLEREVAIKMLNADALVNAATRGRFRTEALALSRLNHPGIATVYEFDHENGADFMVMEYVPGDTLATVAAAGPLSEARVRELGAQIADALAAAHAHGVVHRDLKPGNVVVTPDGRAKVLDFGLARVTTADFDATRSATAPLALVGTLAYMAPEQIAGGDIGPAADLHALGLILYELATGGRPYSGDTVAALLYAIANRPPVSPRKSHQELSEAFASTVLCALAKDPAQRHASARELAEELRNEDKMAGAPRATSGGSAVPPRHEAGAVPGARAAITSLAVLPLVNLSGDPAQEFFADGMTEALIASLAGIGALRVISRTTAMRYKDTALPVRDIARELGVQGVIEGSVQRSADNVRISVQLIDAVADRLLWAQQYEGTTAGVLELQAEAACSVAKEVSVQLTPREESRLRGPRVIDPRAYEAYLRGRFHWNRRTETEMRRGIAQFEQAIAIDPDYPQPYVGIADSYNLLGDMNAMLPHEAAAKSKAALARALELDPELGEAHTSLGSLQMFYDWDWKAARKSYDKALALQPGYPTAHQWYAELLSALGEFDRGIDEARRAYEMDPQAPIMGTTLGDSYFFARRYDEALAVLRHTIEIDPAFYQAINDVGRVLSQAGQYDEALEAFERARLISGANPLASVGIGYTLARAGRTAEARRVLEHLQAESSRRFVSAYAIAAILLGLGDNDQAIEWLERAFRERDRALVWVRVHPRLDPLRGDERFRSLERRVMAAE